jgi:hypothetical protein
MCLSFGPIGILGTDYGSNILQAETVMLLRIHLDA